MKLFLAHLFHRSGSLIHTTQIPAFSLDQARAFAHQRFGSAESLGDDDHELSVVAA